MGVVSGDGMRLKARNDRPRLPGTYPPPRPGAGDKEEIVLGYRRGQGDSCGEWREGEVITSKNAGQSPALDQSVDGRTIDGITGRR